MDISVIVAIHNAERYLEQSLRSLFEQTKREGVEYVLVDDASQDGSRAIIERLVGQYNPSVQIITLERNRGVAAARQRGLDAAHGNYILYIDADDWCEPSMLEELWAQVQCGAEIVVCDYICSSRGGEHVVAQPCSESGKECVDMLLDDGLQGMLWNKLIARELFNRGGVEFVRGINLGEDLVVCVKLFAQARGVRYLPKSYMHYRQHGESIVHRMTPARLQNRADALVEIDRFFAQQGLTSRYEEQLNMRKAQTKFHLLLHSRGAQRRAYAKIFPHADSSIKHHPKLSTPAKLATSLAAQGRGLLSDLVLLAISIWADVLSLFRKK